MDSSYDKVFITNIPAFYKISLYNRIAQKRRILAVFLDAGNSDRNADFYKGELSCDFVILSKLGFFARAAFVIRLFFFMKYGEIVIGGWDRVLYWLAAFVSKAEKNSVVVESSILESSVCGAKGLVKRIFLSNISKAYCSGKLSAAILESLGFKGRIVITRGVGLYKLHEQPPFEPRAKVSKFLYVGRLVDEKNLPMLIGAFGKRPELTLDIAGFGELEDELKKGAPENVVFHGAVPNEDLRGFYRDSDVFVLPSKKEPWGLVVEEALNNGTPVILSDKIGCAPDVLAEDVNGLSFRHDDEGSLLAAIDRICDPDFYNALRKNVAGSDPFEIEERQISSYL